MPSTPVSYTRLGRTLEKDVVLNEGVELQEVVVGGAFQGQRRAINSQKNNMGITNVVSADQVGRDYIRNPHVVFL